MWRAAGVATEVKEGEELVWIRRSPECHTIERVSVCARSCEHACVDMCAYTHTRMHAGHAGACVCVQVCAQQGWAGQLGLHREVKGSRAAPQRWPQPLTVKLKQTYSKYLWHKCTAL